MTTKHRKRNQTPKTDQWRQRDSGAQRATGVAGGALRAEVTAGLRKDEVTGRRPGAGGDRGELGVDHVASWAGSQLGELETDCKPRERRPRENRTGPPSYRAHPLNRE